MNAANQPAENATPKSESSNAKNTADSASPVKPRRRWPLIALVAGLLLLGGQIYFQSEYWGLVLNQGTFFPNMQRAIYMGSRESEEPHRHEALPIPGSPESLAKNVPHATAPEPPEVSSDQPGPVDAKTKP
jgi:hypothetical protein